MACPTTPDPLRRHGQRAHPLPRGVENGIPHGRSNPYDGALAGAGEFDLVEGQENLQVLLDRPLAMEADDFPKADAARHTWRQLLGGFQIGFRLFDPLAQQGLETRIKRLHR